MPSGVDKGTAVVAALGRMGLTVEQAAGVANAENDLAFLSRCGLSVAVGDAVGGVREHVDRVAESRASVGVRALSDDLVWQAASG